MEASGINITNVTNAETSLSPEQGIPAVNEYSSYWNYLSSSASDYAWSRHWIAVCGGMLGVGILGNSHILYAGFLQKKVRNSPFHLLLMNHSLVCLLLALFAYPAMLYKGSIGLVQTDFESKLCQYAMMLMMWWISAGLLSNGIVAVNRAMSCFPHSSICRMLRGHKATWSVLAGVWILSFMLYAVPAVGYPTGWAVNLACLPFEQLMLNINHPEVVGIGYLIQYSCGLNVLCVLTMSIFSYMVIICRLYGQQWFKCVMANSKTPSMTLQFRREKAHALGVIALVFTNFIVCWVPFVWLILWKQGKIREPVYNMLCMLETALNPILYMITMPVFRPRWCTRRNGIGP